MSVVCGGTWKVDIIVLAEESVVGGCIGGVVVVIIVLCSVISDDVSKLRKESLNTLFDDTDHVA